MNQFRGKAMANIRRQRNWSQPAFAKMIGVSQQTVSQWENEKGTPGQERIANIAQVLGVQLSDLVYSESDMEFMREALRNERDSISIDKLVDMYDLDEFDDIPLERKATAMRIAVLWSKYFESHESLKRSAKSEFIDYMMKVSIPDITAAYAVNPDIDSEGLKSLLIQHLLLDTNIYNGPAQR